MSPRETEAAAFVFVNRLLCEYADSEIRMRGLIKNQQLWSLLLKDVSSSENRLHAVLKADLSALGVRIMRHTIAAMGNLSLSVEPLIQVNQDMIAGLRETPPVNNCAPMAILAMVG